MKLSIIALSTLLCVASAAPIVSPLAVRHGPSIEKDIKQAKNLPFRRRDDDDSVIDTGEDEANSASLTATTAGLALLLNTEGASNDDVHDLDGAILPKRQEQDDSVVENTEDEANKDAFLAAATIDAALAGAEKAGNSIIHPFEGPLYKRQDNSVVLTTEDEANLAEVAAFLNLAAENTDAIDTSAGGDSDSIVHDLEGGGLFKRQDNKAIKHAKTDAKHALKDAEYTGDDVANLADDGEDEVDSVFPTGQGPPAIKHAEKDTKYATEDAEATGDDVIDVGDDGEDLGNDVLVGR